MYARVPATRPPTNPKRPRKGPDFFAGGGGSGGSDIATSWASWRNVECPRWPDGISRSGRQRLGQRDADAVADDETDGQADEDARAEEPGLLDRDQHDAGDDHDQRDDDLDEEPEVDEAA